MLNKNRLRKCIITGDKQLQKKESGYFEQRTSSQKNGWKDHRALYIASSKSFEPKKFIRRLNKAERKYVIKLYYYIIKAYYYQPEHGFFRQNEPERCQVRDWYSNKEIEVVPICCSSEWVGVVSY